MDSLVSFYPNLESPNVYQPVSLFDALTLHTWKFQKHVEYARELLQKYGKDGYYKTYKKSMPAFTPSGLFTTRSNEGLIAHSNYICIDVDCDNRFDAIKVKDMFSEIDNVAYCCYSLSNIGVFAIIPIQDGSLHEMHWLALQQDINGILKDIKPGLTIDEKCKNVSRTRTITHDDAPYSNKWADIYQGLASDRNAVYTPEKYYHSDNSDTSKQKALFLVQQIVGNHINITEDTEDWLKICYSFANTYGSEGESLFHDLSQIDSRYKAKNCKATYLSALRAKSKMDISAFFAVCKKHNITVPSDKDFLNNK